MDERWKEVKHYDGLYEVSDMGNIRSYPGKRGAHWGRVREMAPYGRNQGQYYSVTLVHEGFKNTMVLHRLILEAFKGPCPEGYKARHVNGNKYDNRVDNLRWVATRQTLRDEERDKVLAKKLTKFQRQSARELYITGLKTPRQIAKFFGVSMNEVVEALRERNTD